MSGNKNSAYTRLKVLCPNIFYVKCLSHTAHLIAARACKAFPNHKSLFINNGKKSGPGEASPKFSRCFLLKVMVKVMATYCLTLKLTNVK